MELIFQASSLLDCLLQLLRKFNHPDLTIIQLPSE